MKELGKIVLSYSHCFDILNQCGLILQSASSKNLNGSGRLCAKRDLLQPGDIFIAYKGVNFDAHKEILFATSLSAGLIILDDSAFIPKDTVVPWICVSSSRKAWSMLAATGCGSPEKDLNFIGITGTNGKTSTLWILRSMLLQYQINHLSIGTLGIFHNRKQLFGPGLTTPDPDVLYPILRHAKGQGCTIVIMEVSSHALSQEKVAAINFNVAIWTSFSRDHLDFHGSVESYWKAKWSLFIKNLKHDGTALISSKVQPFPDFDGVICKDVYILRSGEKKVSAQTSYQNINLKLMGMSDNQCIEFTDDNREVIRGKIPLKGIYNSDNFVFAYYAFNKVTTFNFSIELWSKIEKIPGRYEEIQVDIRKKTEKPKVIVDFAHTPEALEKLLQSIRIDFQFSKLWVIFGCGGNRDKGKRALMGRIAEKFADNVVITSDNPRSESVESITDDIVSGFEEPDQAIVIYDRKTAIFNTIRRAQKDDIIAICGKGHEQYQIIGTSKIPFSDQLTALTSLKSEM